MKYINKKDRQRCYEIALELIRNKQNTYMCNALRDALYTMGFPRNDFNIKVFPELNFQKPKEAYSIWFIDTNEGGAERNRSKRSNVLLKCILETCVRNPLPAFQNENLKKLKR